MKSMSKKAVEASSITTVGILAESALLAMPDADYMNDQQIAYFSSVLRGMQKQLISTTLTLSEGRMITECEKDSDPVDRASSEEARSNEQMVRANELRQLADVTRSLSKIVSGDYGYCDETGDPIGIPRLLARPTANLTVEEQSRHEKKFARLCG